MISLTLLRRRFLKLAEPVRFILVGCYNTAIGYFCFVVLFLATDESLHYQLTLLLTYLISSSSAFLMLKYFVFLTTGNHLREYFKTLSTYGIAYLLNSWLLYLFVERAALNVLLSQALAVFLVTIFSYLMHKHFSFKTT